MQKGVDDIVASMKKGRERFDAMGRTDPKQKQIDNTRQWKQTRSLTMDMFEKNGYLRFGLEYPQQAVNIPTKNCCTWSGSAQTVVGVPHQSTTAVKDGRGYRQGCGRNEGGAGVMGPQRVLNHGHVRSTIATATNLVDVGVRGMRDPERWTYLRRTTIFVSTWRTHGRQSLFLSSTTPPLYSLYCCTWFG